MSEILPFNVAADHQVSAWRDDAAGKSAGNDGVLYIRGPAGDAVEFKR